MGCERCPDDDTSIDCGRPIPAAVIGAGCRGRLG